ncbi:hypothetical protein [Luteimonas sp. A478]
MTRRLLPLVACALALGTATGAHAQTGTCPQLPADSGLSWEQRGNDAFLICSAVGTDGTEAFGLSLSADSPFQPRRAYREERGVVAGQDIRWYRAEVGTQPDILVRETRVELSRNRVAHIWTRTSSEEALRANMRMVERLDFGDSRMSSN